MNIMKLKNMNVKATSKWHTGACISGGEPTLQKDLPEFIKKLKSFGLTIKLDTNGSNPEMLKELLENKLVDYVAMDVKASMEKYPEIININFDLNKLKQSIEIVKKFPGYEFRTTVLPFFDFNDFKNIGEMIAPQEKVELYTLQQFNPKKTLDSLYENLVPKSKKEINEIKELMQDYAKEVRVLID